MQKYLKFEDRALLYQSLIDSIKLKKIGETQIGGKDRSYVIRFSAGAFLVEYFNSWYGAMSELTVSVAGLSNPDQWYPVHIIKNFLNGADILNTDEGLALDQILNSNDFLRDNFDRVAAVLDKDHYQATISQIDEKLTEEMRKNFRRG